MYFNKMPWRRFSPDKCHWTRKSGKSWKAKRAFDTKDEAMEFADSDNSLNVYECPICHKWHVGHLKQ